MWRVSQISEMEASWKESRDGPAQVIGFVSEDQSSAAVREEEASTEQSSARRWSFSSLAIKNLEFFCGSSISIDICIDGFSFSNP